MPRILSTCLAVLLLSGCQDNQQIASYTVPRDAPPPVAVKKGGEQRLLVAMFARPGGAWTFRLDGPVAEIEQHHDAFKRLVESVRFGAPDDPPTWTMPEGWVREPGNQFRYATLRVGTLEGRVSPSFGEQSTAVLPNLIRFRGEVGLPPAAEADLAKDTKPITVNDVKGTWIDVTGPGGKGKGPMMKF